MVDIKVMKTKQLLYIVVPIIMFLSSVMVSTALAQTKIEREVGADLAAQISGQAAGAFTYHVLSCADLDPRVDEEQRAAARRDLAADRANYPERTAIWDEYFAIGQAQAKAEALVYDEARCREALDFLRTH